MTDVDDDTDPMSWWAISGDALLDLLRRAAAGEDPDLLYAEEYANAEHELPCPG
jgi:hypothetical protein